MDMTANSETRDDVLHVPSLFDFFCSRTAADLRARSTGGEAPAASFASIIVLILLAFAFYVFGQPQLAKAAFVVFGLMLLWTVWGVVIRSSEQLSQKADSVKAGSFPPEAAPYVLARLKWWNLLVVPMRWGRHSRLFDRRGKLERKIAEAQRRLNEAVGRSGTAADYQPPDEAEIAACADSIQTYTDRNIYEAETASLPDDVARLRAELVLYEALLYKVREMTEKLDRIEALTVVFRDASPEDLSQIVSEAIQVLEERRMLVLDVDHTDPEDFISLVTVRAA